LGANLSDAASAFGGGYAAGGGTDIAVRLIGQWLSERLGRQFIPIDGKPPGKAAEAALRTG